MSEPKKYPLSKFSRAVKLLYAYNQSDEKYERGKGDLTPHWIVNYIFSKPCSHCGESDWNKVGCNRIDDAKPHTKDNVEPCCMKCNRKMARPNARIKKRE